MEQQLQYWCVFDFEKGFSIPDLKEWGIQNHRYSIFYSAVYLVAIFGIQRYMRDRERFELRWLLAIWNIGLMFFSGFTAFRLGTAVINIWIEEGYYNSVCKQVYDDVIAFWVMMAILSKVVELGDTFFIVLRKQKLIFLHWYHHITVMVYVYHGAAEPTSNGRWFIAVNSGVHFIMYGYFALKALKCNPPKKIQMLITILQLVQMVYGLFINIVIKLWILEGVGCAAVSEYFTNMGLLLYGSYFVLFVNFFVRSYWSSDKNAKKKVK